MSLIYLLTCLFHVHSNKQLHTKHTTIQDIYSLGNSYIFKKPARSLRSQSAALIEMPKNARTKIYGERRFDVAFGTLWNSLPASLRNEQSLEAFKKGLKTHLFKIAFVK